MDSPCVLVMKAQQPPGCISPLRREEMRGLAQVDLEGAAEQELQLLGVFRCTGRWLGGMFGANLDYREGKNWRIIWTYMMKFNVGRCTPRIWYLSHIFLAELPWVFQLATFDHWRVPH